MKLYVGKDWRRCYDPPRRDRCNALCRLKLDTLGERAPIHRYRQVSHLKSSYDGRGWRVYSDFPHVWNFPMGQDPRPLITFFITAQLTILSNTSPRAHLRVWGCCGLCLRQKPAEFAHSLSFCSCVYFCFYGSFNCVSFHKFSQQRSYFCLIGSFNYIEISL